MSDPFGPLDEDRHAASGDPSWTETWELRLVDPNHQLGVAIAVISRPVERRMSYLTAVFGEGRSPCLVVEHDIVAPASGLELRASGIWADHICETPFEHWSVGLEAFGLAFDSPEEAVTTGHGHSVPMGFDLEWEDEEGPVGFDRDSGYLMAGIAHGEVLVGRERLEVDGQGQRLHRWGPGPRIPAWGWPLDPSAKIDLSTLAPRALAEAGDGSIVEWTFRSGQALESQIEPAPSI